MRRLYEEGGDREGGCPGKDRCQIFQSSAPDQPDEARCPSCPGRALSESSASLDGEETWDETLLLDRVERFVRMRDSGRSVYEVMQPLEWELVMILDETVESWERSQRARMFSAIETLLALSAHR